MLLKQIKYIFSIFICLIIVMLSYLTIIVLTCDWFKFFLYIDTNFIISKEISKEIFNATF